MQIKSIYLIIYNLRQFLGWTLFFIQVLQDVIKSKSVHEIYDETHLILERCQYAAILEICNSLFKIVKSNVLATTIQILGRIAIVAILQYFKSSISVGYLLLSFAWSIIEIIRYSYYILCLINIEYKSFNIPYIHIWCRYSFFIVLFPIGVTGEMITLWNAREDWKKYQLLGKLTVADLVYPLYILYIPSLAFLYSYLFKQRNKELNKKLIEEKKEKNIKKNE